MRFAGLKAAGLAALLLSGCAALQLRPTPWALPPVADAPFRGRWVQMLELERGGKRLPMLAILEADNLQMVLVGLSPAGQRLLRITWKADGSVAQEQDPSVPVRIEAEPILRDVVLANWPEPALTAALAHSAWSVEFNGPKRSLRRGSTLWLTVAPEPSAGEDAIVVDHLVEGYQVHVRTVEKD